MEGGIAINEVIEGIERLMYKEDNLVFFE